MENKQGNEGTPGPPGTGLTGRGMRRTRLREPARGRAGPGRPPSQVSWEPASQPALPAPGFEVVLWVARGRGHPPGLIYGPSCPPRTGNQLQPPDLLLMNFLSPATNCVYPRRPLKYRPGRLQPMSQAPPRPNGAQGREGQGAPPGGISASSDSAPTPRPPPQAHTRPPGNLLCDLGPAA